LTEKGNLSEKGKRGGGKKKNKKKTIQPKTEFQKEEVYNQEAEKRK